MQLPMDMTYLMERQCDAVAECVAAVPDLPTGDCLEIGCSVGNALPILERTFARVTGVDVSAAMVAEARRKVRDPDQVKRVGGWGDGPISYPFPAASFDAIVTFSLFHHLDHRRQLEVLRETRRMIRPRGLVIAFEYNPINPLALATVLFGDDDAGSRPVGMRSLAARFREAGLAPARRGYVLWFPRSLASLSSLESRLRGVPLGGKYYLAGTAA